VPQQGGGRGVLNADAVCRGTAHHGQGYEGVGWYSAVPGAPAESGMIPTHMWAGGMPWVFILTTS